ncbi:hypothetical protein O181_056115 [Austropuccinia psidii MF-1]|uniref:Uncharacterized protein n=1 Tax=Austropuccinia psidii MF-1 TaxID=1389203 RepID=A0A9Q3HVU5_9BASI|nr:hypothetical protein [Austropuccinia psidii MF-1]
MENHSTFNVQGLYLLIHAAKKQNKVLRESQQTSALIAAKDNLLSAYKNFHHSLSRLINLVHRSDPKEINFDCASKSSCYPDPLKSYHQTPFYPAPPQPQAQSTANATPTTTTNNTSNQIK